MSTIIAEEVDAAPPGHTRSVEITDDDRDIREPIAELLRMRGLNVVCHESAESFLTAPRAGQPACLVLDQRLPGMSGTDLLKRLSNNGCAPPAILLTGFANTSTTVDAMRHGAVTVLDKPCGNSAFMDAVTLSLQRDEERRQEIEKRQEACEKVSRLGQREREVLDMVLAGVPNKQIAKKLNVCVRTIEARRSKIYQTVGATSLADLVRTSMLAGIA